MEFALVVPLVVVVCVVVMQAAAVVGLQSRAAELARTAAQLGSRCPVLRCSPVRTAELSAAPAKVSARTDLVGGVAMVHVEVTVPMAVLVWETPVEVVGRSSAMMAPR